MFQVLFTASAKKAAKKLPKQVRQKAVMICEDLLARNPSIGKALQIPFRGYFSHRFQANGVGYRLVYLVDRKNGVVKVVLLGKRENFYQRLQRTLKN